MKLVYLTEKEYALLIKKQKELTLSNLSDTITLLCSNTNKPKTKQEEIDEYDFGDI